MGAKQSSANVTFSKPGASANKSGYSWVAPLGTAIPTDATTELDAAFVGLGYLSEDGLTEPASLTAGDDIVAARTRTALKRLAQRYQRLGEEITAYDTDLAELVDTLNPALVQVKGISVITATQLLITAGDNPERVTSQAAFAMLCGAAPIPASSGKTTRYRLNRGGDRAANSALHRIALVRLATDPTTRAYAEKRITQGKSKKDVLRCLKRAIAREVYRLIVHPRPAQTSSDLRPARHHLGYTLTQVADALGCSPLKISRLEHGHINDITFLHYYRAWLTTQQPLTTTT